MAGESSAMGGTTQRRSERLSHAADDGHDDYRMFNNAD